jgi:RNA polymerase sigma-70 factor (sigma-E family)
VVWGAARRACAALGPPGVVVAEPAGRSARRSFFGGDAERFGPLVRPCDVINVEMSSPVAWHENLLALYRERYESMVRLAYLLTGNRGVAEEIVQDAFVAVHRNWDRATSPGGYLRTTVVNNARTWLRRRTLEERHRPGRPVDAGLAADEMWDMLQRLPERQRAAVVLRFYEDLPDAEIARILGCRLPTVRTAVHRGLAALRKEMGR